MSERVAPEFGKSCLVTGSLIPAGLLWLFTLPFTFMGGPHNPEDGMLVGFAMIMEMALWPLLTVFLIATAGRADLPGLVRIGVVLIAGLAAFASIASFAVMGTTSSWIRITPILLPPLAAFFGLWTARTRDRPWPERIRTIAIFGGVALLLCLPPGIEHYRWLAAAPEREAAYREEERAADAEMAALEARFRALGPDSPIDAYLPFINQGGTFYEPAVAAVRASPRRQRDAIRLLDDDQLDPLQQLNGFALDPTPELCRGFGGALGRRASSLQARGSDQWAVSANLHDQVPNMEWFHANGCDLAVPLRRLIALMRPPGADHFPEEMIGRLEPLTRPPPPRVAGGG